MRAVLAWCALACAGLLVWAQGAPTAVLRGTTVEVGAPTAKGLMQVFPLRAKEQKPLPADFITLDEALAAKVIAVREKDGGQVNTLAIGNTGDKPIYLMAGDIVLGGKQDRQVGQDTVIAPKTDNVAVSVFCVEHGRWTGTGQFDGSTVASGTLRFQTQTTGNQSVVWERVAAENATMGKAPATGTYRNTASDADTQQELKGYVDAFLEPLTQDPAVVGVVVALHGTILAADVFGHHAIFAKQAKKVLSSYGLDAVQAAKKPVPNPLPVLDAARVATFLAEATAGARKDTGGAAGAAANGRVDGKDAVTLDATYGTPEAGNPAPSLHLNIYNTTAMPASGAVQPPANVDGPGLIPIAPDPIPPTR